MFDIKVGEEGTIYLSGRFDASQVDRADEVFLTITESATADCADLDYISSAGIGIILKTFKRLHDSGQNLKLVNMQQRIRNVFHVSGLDKIIVIE